MKYRVDQLEGALLDAAVAKAIGLELDGEMYYQTFTVEGIRNFAHREPMVAVDRWKPSSDWSMGGPIIEREQIIWQWSPDETSCMAFKKSDGNWMRQAGPTPLIAAMRAFVAAKLGDEWSCPSTHCTS